LYNFVNWYDTSPAATDLGISLSYFWMLHQ
jgi:hypothetical protein